MLRLWAHECERVFQDRLLSAPEASAFQSLLANVAAAHFPGDEVCEQMLAPPLIFSKIVPPANAAAPAAAAAAAAGGWAAASGSDGGYVPIPGMPQLEGVLEQRLADYNDGNPMMDLVLFEQVRWLLVVGEFGSDIRGGRKVDN